jgi:hypothetical protein
MKFAACLMPLLLLATIPASAESFRCGSRIVSEDSTVEELLALCGEPTSKTVETVDVYGPAASGSGRVKRGTITIEKWTYDRGSQSFPMLVTIEDGRIKSMERGQ